MSKSPLLVGIAGASASGKTSLAKTIQECLPSEQIQLICEDSYYHDQSHLSIEEREFTNYDHPLSTDHDLLHRHLEMLKNGRSIEAPTYDFTIHTRSKDKVTVNPTPIIVVEGIMLFTHEQLRNTMDLKIFVDAPLDICLMRRIQRDMVERNRTLESIFEQYQRTVRPGYRNFIRPTMEYADIIVPRGGKNKIAIDLIETKLKSMV
ncbi:MAG: uridine kinase [Saccharospirillaceae bacterium]|jgi:uridine kinase|nr:uridine kinase [Thalassolituus sp. HI0120]MCH2041500.1 uridine kinase [Saccharospirillaceae bacterium]